MARSTDRSAAPTSSGRPDAPSLLVEAAARNDRLVVGAALALVGLLAWSYLLGGAGMDMGAMNMDAAMVMPADWTPRYALLMFLMWWIMMVAMMLPSAAPLILLFALVNRRNREREAPFVPTALFAAGYLLAWGAFSLGAVIAHWLLDRSGWLTMAMSIAGAPLGGALLIAAGLYQLTPFKHTCLRHCRGPVDFVAHHWRPGYGGALRMGLSHGAYCVGCCWMTMGLLFYGGVMNPYWILGLTALVLLEKFLPAGPLVGKLSGVLCLLWGGWLLI